MVRRILLLAGKDTITYRQRPGHEAVVSAAELLATVPADLLAAEVVPVDLDIEPGWDISPGSMLALAGRVRTALVDDGFHGVVVAHGPDTLAETAFLADLLAGPAAELGGIVFTTAGRRLDDLSSDGPANLAAAVAAAADPALAGRGAVLCANDQLHAARWATLAEATGVARFTSAPHGPIGRVTGGRVDLSLPPQPRPPVAAGQPESDVALLSTYPGMSPALLTAAVDAGAAGVVLEGTGAGNVPASLLAAVSDLVAWDVPVVIASRCPTGGTPLAALDPPGGMAARLGAVGARGLSAPKARVALMVALGAADTPPGTAVARAAGVADAGSPRVAAVAAWFDRL